MRWFINPNVNSFICPKHPKGIRIITSARTESRHRETELNLKLQSQLPLVIFQGSVETSFTEAQSVALPSVLLESKAVSKDKKKVGRGPRLGPRRKETSKRDCEETTHEVGCESRQSGVLVSDGINCC